jgi:hypothetical protein
VRGGGFLLYRYCSLGYFVIMFLMSAYPFGMMDVKPINHLTSGHGPALVRSRYDQLVGSLTGHLTELSHLLESDYERYILGYQQLPLLLHQTVFQIPPGSPYFKSLRVAFLYY